MNRSSHVGQAFGLTLGFGVSVGVMAARPIDHAGLRPTFTVACSRGILGFRRPEARITEGSPRLSQRAKHQGLAFSPPGPIDVHRRSSAAPINGSIHA